LREFLKRRLGFTGRISRGRFWVTTVLSVLVLLAGAALFIALGIMMHSSANDPITYIAAFVFFILVVAITIKVGSAGARRLHDRGKSGWWIILYYCVPAWALPQGTGWKGPGVIFSLAATAILIWAFIDLGFLHGDDGENAYGPIPLG
jgi:uncharacterized membrane protein YhaH (DUF805 family)